MLELTINHDTPTRRDFLKRGAGLGACLLGCRQSFAQFDGPPLPFRDDNPAILHLKSNCIECGRCREFCHDVTSVYAYTLETDDEDCDGCTYCGQCTLFCKADAISERFHYPIVAQSLKNPEKIVVASTAPALRVSLGEEFGMAPGTNVEGKIVAGLRKLGVDYVLDMSFAADLTVMEEAAELVHRLTERKRLPMFTSCCPAWVRFAGMFYPHLLPKLSTCKSPLMMQGALVKTYFCDQHKIDPKKICHVALTPCTAKKAEILLPEIDAAAKVHGARHMRDVDLALTCRETALLLKEAKVAFKNLPDEKYDSITGGAGGGSGAGMIFGNTGGVTEATLRTAYRLLNDKNPPEHFFETSPVRGLRYGREATVDLGVRKLKVAIIHGIGNTRPFLEAVQKGEVDHELVEIMACPGGCIGGGGQPKDNTIDPALIRRQRIAALYKHDTEQKVRLSYENSEIKKIYADFLGKPLGEHSKRFLHVAER